MFSFNCGQSRQQQGFIQQLFTVDWLLSFFVDQHHSNTFPWSITGSLACVWAHNPAADASCVANVYLSLFSAGDASDV